MSVNASNSQPEQLAALTSQCVKCGLCLPHCPTFQLTGNEAASPRGRVTLSEHIIGAEHLNTSENSGISGAIDDCLQCQACESACPSDVQLSEIIRLTRMQLPPTPAKKRTAALTRVLHSPWRRRLLARALRLMQITRLDKLARRLPGTAGHSLRHALPVPASLPLAEWHPCPDHNQQSKTVGILSGCGAELFDIPRLAALAQLVQAVGFNAWVPAGQSCCGALAHHYGQDIRQQRQTNARAFAKPPHNTRLHAVLVLNTGCGAHLLQQTDDLPYTDAITFLHQHRHRLRFRPNAMRVFAHQPCSQRHGTHSNQAMLDLLRCVPDLCVLTGDTGCCGAAGSYFLTRPALSDSLAQQWKNTIASFEPDLILSPNIGCSMQWHSLNTGIPVEHPVAFLARQLDRRQN